MPRIVTLIKERTTICQYTQETDYICLAALSGMNYYHPLDLEATVGTHSYQPH